MQRKTLKYIGFYDSYTNIVENRNSRLSATNKMDYIIKTLKDIGYTVEIISPSWTTNNKFYKGKSIKIMTKVTLKLFPTLPWRGRLLKLVSVIFSFSCLFIYLLISTNKHEQIIIYHSKWMSIPILFLKKIKKGLTVILEVEEVYSDVKPSRFWRAVESKLFNSMDKYIFPTELLNSKLNNQNKPYVIVHGEYNINEIISNGFQNDKIHVVYAGTFDQTKGGAMAAIESAKYLPKNYHVHIIGFGSNEETKLILKKIDEVSKQSESTITYDGLLNGKEYILFLQNCDIGLSTQNPNATYNDTSFPSKILSYMSNGLRVVTAPIKVVENSDIGDKVYYYSNQNPKAIAEAIKSININDVYDSRSLIKQLDKNFVEKISYLVDT